MKLFVGDNCDPTLPEKAKQYNTNACLLTKNNIGIFSTNDVFYTSLADLGEELFFSVCKQATSIYYHIPQHWSGCNDQKTLVEMVLCYIDQFVPVENIEKINLPYKQFKKSYLKGTRQTPNTQMWSVGCSITAGFGIAAEKSWPMILASKFDLPLTNLAEIGSGIVWQSDQICQADIRPGDLVFWGIPSHNRIDVIDPDTLELEQLNPGRFFLDNTIKNKFSIEILDSPSIVYHNVLAVRRAVNYCKKIKANITIMGLMNDFDLVYKSYGVKEFKQYWSWPMTNVDYADDHQHPGPRQHAIFADEFQKFYFKLYSNSN